jgi:hypothetical protein
MMTAKDEQIRAILSYDTWNWAVNQLGPQDSIDEKRFRDFISVTESEVEQYVHEHGFDKRVVFESKDAGAWLRLDADDHICITKNNEMWEVFYTERGKRSQEASFPSWNGAAREVVRRLFEGAKIMLNHRYRLAHPEMNLPLPSEMD